MTANTELFGRIYQLAVGPAGGEGRQWSNQGGPGLRVRFKISKSGDATPNKAEIAVYNLSADSRQFLDSYDPKTWAVRLSAGYELDALCKSRGLRWSIQDGVLQILPIGQGLDLTAFVIGPASGLVGSPERTETGVKFKSLLQGGINPGRLIQLESAYLKGLYVTESVDHTGDTHDFPWYTTVDAFRIS